MRFTNSPRELSDVTSEPSAIVIHAARVSLSRADDEVADTTSTEHARAARFAHEVDGHRHLIGRALVRRALASRLRCAPREVPITTDAAGKPQLNDDRAAFSITHSGDWVLAAIAPSGRVGIDIEEHRPLTDLDRLFDLVSSPTERDEWARLSPIDRGPAFFALWARKEAWVKALGVGIAHVSELEVAIDPDEYVENAAREIMRAGEDVSNWCVRPLPGFTGATAAVAWDRPAACVTLDLASGRPAPHPESEASPSARRC